MEGLQGSAIPRCYGHFTALVEAGHRVNAWTLDKGKRQEPEYAHNNATLTKILESVDTYDSDEEDHIDYPRVVTILLLERHEIPKWESRGELTGLK